MSVLLKILLPACLVMLLAACGGAGNSPGANPPDPLTPRLLPTVFTVEGRPLNSCTFSPACSGNPAAPFFAFVTMAPADGATLAGVVRLEVSGDVMANVELLPAGGGTASLDVFNLTGDQTRAWLDLDTTRLPNGPLAVRISAFNRPAGQSGAAQITAMPARIWNISNPPAPSPIPFTAALSAAPADGARVHGITRLEVHGNGMANVELLPANGYTPRLAVFNVSADKTLAWLDLDTASLPDGVTSLRVSAFNVEQGQPGGQEIIAMPTRHWDFRNGQTAGPDEPFVAAVTLAPLNGELVSGVTRLEVRGSALQNLELLPPVGYAPRLGVFNISADARFAWLDFDSSVLPNGVLNARISAFNLPAGSPNAREIIAMPARQWNLKH